MAKAKKAAKTVKKAVKKVAKKVKVEAPKIVRGVYDQRGK
jgi:hypothetical protein